MPLIVSYLANTGPRWGLLVDGMVHEWEGSPFAGEPPLAGRPLGAPETLRLLPPAQPSKIVCVGRNYAAHAAEHQADVPDEPMLFLKPPSALIAQGDRIVIPAGIGRVDHEAELAVIIKQPAYRVSRDEALSVVLGYTCANDVSARALQKKDGQWGRAKGFDTFCPLGPWISTDLDPSNLLIQAWVNGELRQQDTTAHMVFDVPTLIAFISSVMTLRPGDVILTGTPAGVSELHDGDRVEVEIEGVGRLTNPVQGDH